jgi:hypothetical protein
LEDEISTLMPLNKILKTLITITFLLLGCFQVFAKRDTIPLLKISVYKPKGLYKNSLIPYSDSLKINFDGGFKGDYMLMQIGKECFAIDSLVSDPLYGFAESIRIPKPKPKRKQLIYIFLNGQSLGSIRFKKKFSEVHVDYFKPKNEFRWTYHVFKFVYL